MPTAAECWSFARECEAWAAALRQEQDRKIFLEMAKAWVELALKEQCAFRTKLAAKPGDDERQPPTRSKPVAWIRRLRLGGWAGSRAAARPMEESPVSPASRRLMYQIRQVSRR
jgi:hypothetical protein